MSRPKATMITPETRRTSSDFRNRVTAPPAKAPSAVNTVAMPRMNSRVETIVKTFEWTWTTAVVFCVGLWFFILIFAVVVPSFWMYFAEQKLGWAGPSGGGSWALEIRDAIALGLSTGPLLTIVVAAVIMQNWRKRLRGGSAERPTGGPR